MFRYPHDEKINFIKRVVGLPGDIVDYKNKRLRVNGNVIDQAKPDEEGTEQGMLSNNQVRKYIEHRCSIYFLTWLLDNIPCSVPSSSGFA